MKTKLCLIAFTAITVLFISCTQYEEKQEITDTEQVATVKTYRAKINALISVVNAANASGLNVSGESETLNYAYDDTQIILVNTNSSFATAYYCSNGKGETKEEIYVNFDGKNPQITASVDGKYVNVSRAIDMMVDHYEKVIAGAAEQIYD